MELLDGGGVLIRVESEGSRDLRRGHDGGWDSNWGTLDNQGRGKEDKLMDKRVRTFNEQDTEGIRIKFVCKNSYTLSL